MFKRILIANRGEIALRIMRACREMKIETVAVFSEEDRGSAYLGHADQAFCVGPAAAKDSYLKSDRIIAAAEVAGADAIHPGYGFLAENAKFADMCRESGMEFIGPTADAMRMLGDKAEARKIAKKAKVPTIPGLEELPEDENELIQKAEEIGFPIMVKAAAGGGGRGMRIVFDKTDLQANLKQASQEAKAAFQDGTLYLEKFIEKPRHVEVQIIGDQQGNVRHLGERDCTTQRRYQKLIEESPSPSIDARTRTSLCQAAVRLGKTVGYHTAGTVEFLVDAKGRFYFIEVNTRIQVEHPVSEQVCNMDLIKEQIRCAAGETISWSQRSLQPRGHSIECRVNAEDPAHNFRPCAGMVEKFRPPGGFGVRVDTHAHDGYHISPRYDSLLAKVIVHQPTRMDAIRSMCRCLSEFTIEPTATTIPFLLKVLEHPEFAAGEIDTGFVDRVL